MTSLEDSRLAPLKSSERGYGRNEPVLREPWTQFHNRDGPDNLRKAAGTQASIDVPHKQNPHHRVESGVSLPLEAGHAILTMAAGVMDT